MSKLSSNVLRNIRIQLKTGYMRNAPEEFFYMRRFPPIVLNELKEGHPITAPSFNKVYERVVNSHPRYADENVYGGYSQYETLGLTIAKRQYEILSEGTFNQAQASKIAQKYAAKLENKAYLEIIKLNASLKKRGVGTIPKPLKGKELSEYKHWKSVLGNTFYSELSILEKAKLEKFIHTSILEWNQLERSRRMKDLPFYIQFNKLVRNLFPMDANLAVAQEIQNGKEIRQNFISLTGIDYTSLSTLVPFHIEDYVYLHNKFIEQPNIAQWDSSDVKQLDFWIASAATYRSVFVDNSTEYIKYYLDTARSSFFPFIHNPTLAKTAPKLTVNGLKETLQSQGIGFKKTNEDKLAVRRFYNIPMTLYPLHTLATNLTKNLKDILPIYKDAKALENYLKEKSLFYIVKDNGGIEKFQQIIKDEFKFLVKREKKETSKHELFDMQVLASPAVTSSSDIFTPTQKNAPVDSSRIDFIDEYLVEGDSKDELKQESTFTTNLKSHSHDVSNLVAEVRSGSYTRELKDNEETATKFGIQDILPVSLENESLENNVDVDVDDRVVLEFDESYKLKSLLQDENDVLADMLNDPLYNSAALQQELDNEPDLEVITSELNGLLEIEPDYYLKKLEVSSNHLNKQSKQWKDLLFNHLGPLETRLEHDRIRLLTGVGSIALKNIHTADDLAGFDSQYRDVEATVRAKLARKFEIREFARITEISKKRKPWADSDFVIPHVEVAKYENE